MDPMNPGLEMVDQVDGAAPAEDPGDDLISLTQIEVDRIIEKARLARQDQQEMSERRTANLDAYLRRPYGNEIEGRSDYVSADVHNQVEQTFSVTLKQALSTSQKIKFTGPNQEVADALRVACQQVIQDLGAQRIYSTVIKSGLISIFAAAKVWWHRKFKKVETFEPAVTEEKLAQLRQAMQMGLCQALDIVPNEVQYAEYQAPGESSPSATIQGAQTYQVRAVMLELETSQPMVQPVPPEELLVERGKAEMDDRRGIGLEVPKTVGELLRMQDQLSLPGKPFFRNLQKAIDAAGADVEDGTARTERESREALHFSASSPYEASASGTKLSEKKKLLEWVDYVESNGEEVWARIWMIGRTCVRCEPNEQGIVPYAGWSPISVPHSMQGMCPADNNVHEQKMRSSLARGVLDQVGFALDREVFVRDADTDVLGLQKRFPGKIIVGMPGESFQFAEPPVIDPRIYQAMDWLQNEQQTTGPSNPLTWGGQPDPREKTATGTRIRSNASMWRLDTVNSNFTEQFLVPVHNKLIYLFQQNLDKPLEVLVDGKKITLTKDMIQGSYACVADYQVELDFDDSTFMKAKMLADDAMNAAQRYPMLYPLGVITEYRKRLILASGERSTEKLIAPPAPGMEGWFPGSTPPAQPGPPWPPSGSPPRLALPPGPPGAPPPIPPHAGAPVARRDQAMGQGSAQPNVTAMGGA